MASHCNIFFPTGLPDVPVWALDFEFQSLDGNRPVPRCMVAKNFHSGDTIRLWLHGEAHPCPFRPDDLLVAYFSSAEAGCFLSLGWEIPKLILDPYVEFKNFLAGRPSPYGFGLLGAAAYFGIPTTTTSASKDENRSLAQQDTFTNEEKGGLINYCEQDVLVTERVLRALLPHITNLPQALLRGRYMRAVAFIEQEGIPIDVDTFERLQRNWVSIKADLIGMVDADFGTYENGHFKASLWGRYCSENQIAWPRLPSGKMDLKDDTFREMARIHPRIQPIKELRATLGQLKLNKLSVGADGHNRYLISPFGSITGRNTPSNQKSIFGPAAWIRNLIKPADGMAIAYIDYEQQEFGIAASLSGDVNMQEAYNSGDPYLSFAKQAGAVPLDATKQSHPKARELYKATTLAVGYGMGPDSLALRIGQSREHAQALLSHHKAVYHKYWSWSDQIEAQGMLSLPLKTVFGWRTMAGHDPNPRSLRNFPVQANGAEMLRIAIIGLVESGISVCAPVHDAVLIEAPIDQIDQVVASAKAIMEEASRVVLNGFMIRTDAKIVRYPDRYSDPRGVDMWAKLMTILDNIDVGNARINCGNFPLVLWESPSTVLSYIL